jgi:hypothetical protein
MLALSGNQYPHFISTNESRPCAPQKEAHGPSHLSHLLEISSQIVADYEKAHDAMSIEKIQEPGWAHIPAPGLWPPQWRASGQRKHTSQHALGQQEYRRGCKPAGPNALQNDLDIWTR